MKFLNSWEDRVGMLQVQPLHDLDFEIRNRMAGERGGAKSNIKDRKTCFNIKWCSGSGWHSREYVIFE